MLPKDICSWLLVLVAGPIPVLLSPLSTSWSTVLIQEEAPILGEEGLCLLRSIFVRGLWIYGASLVYNAQPHRTFQLANDSFRDGEVTYSQI